MTLASRRVLVIGATGACSWLSTDLASSWLTGPCGEIFAELALQEGHVVTLYLRNEAKLKPHLRARCNVHVGQLQDEGKLADALSTGIDAIISFAGPPTTWRAPLNTGTVCHAPSHVSRLSYRAQPITEGYRVLFSVMRKAGIRRALILSDACYTVPDDRVRAIPP
jgi:putative NADH-flavin reductase